MVIFGGQSPEHDVSRISALHVIDAAKNAGYDITAIGITLDGKWIKVTNIPSPTRQAAHSTKTKTTSSDPAATDAYKTTSPKAIALVGEQVSPAVLFDHKADFVVFSVMHGPLGEDGSIQGMCEMANRPYVGAGVLASSLCMDKAAAKAVLSNAGIAQAKHHSVRAGGFATKDIDAIIASLGENLFVKPANMGSSVGVSKAVGPIELAQALEVAQKYDDWIVVEEAVDCRELEVAVLGNQNQRASVVGEVITDASFYSYDDKYVNGTSRTQAPAEIDDSLSEKARSLALEATKALHVEGLARVDFFYEQNGRGLLLNEINTMPGFTPISMFPKLWQASGLTYPQLIEELIGLAKQRHSSRQRFRVH